jgi:hypothetical protein
MDSRIIQKLIKVQATPDKVWRVFTDPGITRHLGGEYVSTWKVGGPFGWKSLEGKIMTQGTILQLSPGKLLKHNLFDLENKNQLLSTITYEFKIIDDKTMILAKEELHYEVSDEQFRDMSIGWNFALKAVKEVAEGIVSA